MVDLDSGQCHHMETSKVNELLEGRTVFAQEVNGQKIYYVLPQDERQNAETGYRVLHIGRPSDEPTRCVLLLGETGTGKTTFINAVVNYLFGVKFDDPFRLQVKEEIEEGRPNTESQTDAITAYIIHYKEGMRHNYNFVLIDTPGLADTRGAQRQEHTMSGLEAFLVSADVGVDELHCVGLVAKSNTNRNVDSQKAMLGEIISLLGNSVPDITCIIATFAQDNPSVDAVVRNAGITFTSMFPFDNGILYTPEAINNTSQRRQPFWALRWDDMTGQYDTFFSALIRAPSVSFRILREKKLFYRCKRTLKEETEGLATLISELDIDKEIYRENELLVAENKEWKKEHISKNLTYKDPGKGLYAHNCKICQQTCHTCARNIARDAVGAVVSGAGSLAGGATAGTVLGTETVLTTGAVAVGSATLLVSGAVAAASGLLAGSAVWKMWNRCKLDSKSGCKMNGCGHQFDDHVLEDKKIETEYETKIICNTGMKKLHDEAASKLMEAKERIISHDQMILSSMRKVSTNTVNLLHHGKRIQELSLRGFDYIEDVASQIIYDIRMGKPDLIPQAIRYVLAVKEAMRQLAPCTAEEVRGKHDLVENVLMRLYRER